MAMFAALAKETGEEKMGFFLLTLTRWDTRMLPFMQMEELSQALFIVL